MINQLSLRMMYGHIRPFFDKHPPVRIPRWQLKYSMFGGICMSLYDKLLALVSQQNAYTEKG